MTRRPPISTLFPYTSQFRSIKEINCLQPLKLGDLCLVLLLAVLLLLLLVAPSLNCLGAVKKPPPLAFNVMCLLPITKQFRHGATNKIGRAAHQECPDRSPMPPSPRKNQHTTTAHI